MGFPSRDGYNYGGEWGVACSFEKQFYTTKKNRGTHCQGRVFIERDRNQHNLKKWRSTEEKTLQVSAISTSKQLIRLFSSLDF